MAVGFDAASTSGNLSSLSGSSASWSHTCSGIERALYVIVCGYDDDGDDISSITASYNGVAMTKLGGQYTVGGANTVIFELINPPAGTYNIALASLPPFIQMGAGGISYNGVHQTDPTPSAVVNAGGFTPSTVNVTGLASGDIALMAFYDGDNDNPNPDSGTKRFSQLMSGARAIGADRTGTGTVTCSYTGVAFGYISAVRIQASNSAVLGGGLAAQSAAVAGAVSTTARVSGAIAAQSAVILGRVNSLRVSGALAVGTAQISGAISLAGLLTGNLAVGSAQIAGVMSPIASFSGSLAVQNAAIVGAYEAEYIHVESMIWALEATISGSIEVIPQRPARFTEVRSQRKGYKRPFAIFVDEK
jgi:hypothetical protein